MNNYKVPSYYAVVDFECTAREIRKDWIFEIIEFPVIFLNALTLKIEFTFHRYCRPVINDTLTQFCIDLTGISQKQVDEANTLDVVLKEMEEFLAKRNLVVLCDDPPDDKTTFVWASDGVFDFHDFLFVECNRKEINLPPIFDRILDVRHNFRTYTRKSGNIQVMLEYFNLKFEGRQHSGMDDAKNIVRIMIALLGKYKKLFWETRNQGETRRDRQRKPRLGDWICPDCNETNFSSRDKCFRCNIKRPQNIPRVQQNSWRRQGRGRGRQNQNRGGYDWTCPNTSCSFSNWASRDQCFKCKSAKPPALDMEAAASVLNDPSMMMHAGPGMGMHPGMINTAMFSPMNMNFMNSMMMNPAMSPLGGYSPPFAFGMQQPSLQQPNKAESETSHEPHGAGTTQNESNNTNSNAPSVDTQMYNNAAFSPGGGYYGPGSPAGLPGSPAMSPGGMMMPFMNMMTPMMNGGMGYSPNNPYAMQNHVPAPKLIQTREDGSAYWICQTCNTHNFHQGSQCHGCGAAWICPTCTFNNYAFRNKCLRCKSPKPAEPVMPPSPDPAATSTSLVTMEPTYVEPTQTEPAQTEPIDTPAATENAV